MEDAKKIDIWEGIFEKLNKIKASNDLTDKVVALINDLEKRGDDRIREISEAYFSITRAIKNEEDMSRVPWKVLEYLETHHLDLYRQIQTSKLQT
ncbi:MAG: hypothetical protein U1B79_01330 [Candidatus Pacearchaeota archaeon]|nr:hypothetical protein [Nanoarchaeota archaeon]MDZ4226733.1 hypothetical protein [Candidatus Pacearchaeota archaeon]